jgi:hypothetical protein
MTLIVQSSARNLLDFALLQSVAESYLHLLPGKSYSHLGTGERTHSLAEILSSGNNHPDLNPTGTGATRLTPTQQKYFVDNFEIVTHYPNDASGFSATLFKRIGSVPPEYTLSFRSTEFQFGSKGGDWERDGNAPTGGADNDIADYGFAVAQLAAMEKMYDQKRGQVHLFT